MSYQTQYSQRSPQSNKRLRTETAWPQNLVTSHCSGHILMQAVFLSGWGKSTLCSKDMNTVELCRRAPSQPAMRKGYVCVSVCVSVVELTAVSNGSCLTGPWEMESKRSIRYNVNNDPSSHCAARDKSIKDPSHLVITNHWQQHTERKRVKEKAKRGSKIEWISKQKTIILASRQNSGSHCVKKCSLTIQRQAFFCHALVGYFLRSICSSMECDSQRSDPLAATLITH